MALKPALELPARKDTALFLVLFEGGVEALPVHRQPALQGELFRKFEGEAVGIVEAERLLAADDRFFNVGRVLLRHEGVLALEPLHALFKFLDSLREGGFEAVCLVLISERIYSFFSCRLGYASPYTSSMKMAAHA